MGSLSNQFISQSFISLIHLGNDNIITSSFTVLQDGLGNSLNISVNAQGDISASGNIYAANLTGSAGSINTGSFVTTSSFNSYTSSTNARLSSIETSTASFSNSITSLNASSASQQLEINALEATSGSLITSASNALYTASFNNGTRNLTFTKGDTTQFSVNIPDASGSILPSGTISSSAQISELGFVSSSVTASSLTTASISGQTITFTKGDASTFNVILPSGSVPTDITALNNFTASVAGTNTFTQSAQISINALNAETSSYAKLNVNNQFTTSQTITGSLVVTGDITANKLNVIIESSSVIYSSGSNIFGDEATDVQTLNGQVIVTNALTASSLRVENNTYLDGTLRVTNDTTINGDVTIQSATPNLKLRDTSGGGFSSGYDVRVDTGSFEIYDDTHNRDVLSDVFNPSTSKHTTSLTSEILVLSGSDSVTIEGNLTASLQQGYAWVGNGSGVNTQVPTSSFGDTTDLGPLNAFSASTNLFTASADQRLDSIEAQSGSWVTSAITASSVQSISSTLASLQFDYVKGDGSSQTVTLVAPAGTDLTALNNATASLQAFTASVAGTNTFTQSAQLEINSLEAFTASALTTASANLNTITFTKGDGSTFAVTVNTGSAGGSSFPFTGSALITGSLGVTGSIASQATTLGTSNLVQINLDSISPIRIADRDTGGSQAILISGSQIATRQNQIRIQNENRSRIVLASGANSSGNDRTTFTVTNNGTARAAINGYIGTAIGFNYQDADDSDANALYISASNNSGTVRNFMGFNARPNEYAGSQYNYVFAPANASLGGMRVGVFGHMFVSQSFTASLQSGFAWVGDGNGYSRAVATSSFAGTPVDISALNAFTASIAGTNTFTASAQLEINALEAFTASIAGTNAFTASAQQSINALNGATSSYAISSSVAAVDLGQQNQIDALIAWTGSGAVTDISALNAFTASIAGTNAFTASTSLRLDSLESTSASVNTSLASLNGFTASVAGTNLFTQSAQLEINALEAFSGSALTTASFSGNTLTFTKGNGTTFGVTIPDVSGSTINTGSFATTGSNAFVGNQTITGSLILSSSAETELNIVGNSVITGSLFLSSSAAIELSVIGNSVFSGSVQGRVIPVTISSNTASLDFSQGNFFTVALAATVGTHISASNVQPGETVSIRITQNATPGTVTYPPSMKFASGSAYVASTTAGAVDIVTFISYDNATVYASSVKNMI